MPDKLVHGVYAAVLTPRHQDGTFDEHSFAKLLRFLLERSIRGFALNGATGEFCLTSPAELERILAVACSEIGSEADFLCGIGSAGAATSIELGKIAAHAGAKAMLLPMPYFFPYQQQDLEAFSRTVASAVPKPVLLYNLPQFTSGLEPETSLRLIRECPNIIGIKDSSGSLDTLRVLTSHGVECCRLVGSDNALVGALQEGLCDGVVSGVACVLPELIGSIFYAEDPKQQNDSTPAVRALNEFISQISDLPVPWGLKWAAECHGLGPAHFAQPLSSERKQQGEKLKNWFKPWHQELADSDLLINVSVGLPGMSKY